MKKKIIAIGIIIVLILTFFTVLPCKAEDITHKSSKIVTSGKDAISSTTSLIKGNSPLPPLMWTEDFSTLYIKIPGDPGGDIVYYCIDWGDGNTEWTGWYESNATVALSHIWDEGEYTIKVKAKNQYGEESKWATYGLILSSDFKIFHISIGYVGITYIFTIYWKDCVYYLIDWGDGSSSGWIGPYPEEIVIITHTWSSPREYMLKLKGKDIYGNQSDWLTLKIWIITFENNPPSAPVIDGPKRGRPRTYKCTLKPGTYNYTFKATDPDGDNVSYYIDWGDGTCEGWIGWYASGEEVIRNHTWNNKGTYTISAKAKDIYGAEGPWGTLWIWFSGSSQQPTNSLFLQFLEQFPILKLLLQRLGLQ